MSYKYKHYFEMSKICLFLFEYVIWYVSGHLGSRSPLPWERREMRLWRGTLDKSMLCPIDDYTHV